MCLYNIVLRFYDFPLTHYYFVESYYYSIDSLIIIILCRILMCSVFAETHQDMVPLEMRDSANSKQREGNGRQCE